MPTILDENITYLKGVGPNKANVLASELHIKTYGDLLYHFPYKYVDRTRFYKINELNPQMNFVQLKGKVSGYEMLGEKRKQRLVVKFFDESGSVKLIWFKGAKWIAEKLKTNTEYIHGKDEA